VSEFELAVSCGQLTFGVRADGLQQDLFKTSAFRALMRARRECTAALGEAKCGGMATDALANSTRFALKLGEHTWGFNWGYLDSRSYTNSDLADALATVGGFAKTQDGWMEQRRYVDYTISALQNGAAAGDEGCAWLLKRTQAELAKLRPTTEPNHVQPSTPAVQDKAGGENDGEWVEIHSADFAAEITLPLWRSLAWNHTAGGISKLVHKQSGHNFARASGTGSLAQYQYQTLTENDFWIFMNATLKVQREVAFGKFNLTANAPNVVSGSWTGKLLRMYRNHKTTPGSISPASVPRLSLCVRLRVAVLHVCWRGQVVGVRRLPTAFCSSLRCLRRSMLTLGRQDTCGRSTISRALRPRSTSP
jgi:hypothetical protein